ncbi:MAG TPA: 50S ribosomal protein L11 methyltransferase [Devosiaceae bacterium]|jgi:predicted nicotinamide N-methyase
MHVLPAPAVPEIRLYTAHPASGLWRLVGRDEDHSEPPYWAYRWAGGTVLARHVLDHPETVRGRHVLDLGSGSGIVGIAAAKSGARSVLAAEIDPNGLVALGLNAVENGVTLTPVGGDLTCGSPPGVDLILVGDLFYAAELAERVTAFLDRSLAMGIDVLVGDPGRAHLPHDQLRPIAQYLVPDFGSVRDATTLSSVFAFEAARDAASIER